MTSAIRKSDLADPPPLGGRAYVDRDWMEGRETDQPVAALIFDPAQGVRWPHGEWLEAPDGVDPDLLVAAMLDAHARGVVRSLPPTGSVAVPGMGVLAKRIHELVGERATTDLSGAPAVVVETTGSARGICDAAAAAADLGCVLLAASPPDGTIAYDLYQDVHRRGLRLVGVPNPEATQVPGGLDVEAGAGSAVPPPAAADPAVPAQATWLVFLG